MSFSVEAKKRKSGFPWKRLKYGSRPAAGSLKSIEIVAFGTLKGPLEP